MNGVSFTVCPAEKRQAFFGNFCFCRVFMPISLASTNKVFFTKSGLVTTYLQTARAGPYGALSSLIGQPLPSQNVEDDTELSAERTSLCRANADRANAVVAFSSHCFRAGSGGWGVFTQAGKRNTSDLNVSFFFPLDRSPDRAIYRRFAYDITHPGPIFKT